MDSRSRLLARGASPTARRERIRPTRGGALVLVLACTAGMGVSASPASPADPVAASVRRGEAYAELMQALLAARRGEASQALASVERAIERVPDSADLLAASAELLLQWTGRIADSERLARRAVELDPGHPVAVRLLAELAAARALDPEGDEASRAEAIRLFEKLVLDPEQQIDALEALAQLRVRAGDLAGAVLDVRRLIELRPGDPRTIQMLTQLLLRTDREADALEALLGYLARHPEHEELFGWAEQLANGQDAWPAVVAYLDAQAPLPSDAAFLNRFHGEALLRVGRVQAAVDALERAAAARPDDHDTRKFLALAYRGQGRLAEAARLFEELTAEVAPDAPLVHRLLAETLAEQNEVERALESFGTALAALRERADVSPVYRDSIRERVATLHFDREAWDAALAMLDELEEPEGPVALEIRCRIAIARRDYDEAQRLARAVAASEQVGRARLLEGEIAIAEGKWSKATGRFEEAIAELGPYLRATVAEVYRKAGRPEEGLQLLADWAVAAPDLADARFHLGVYQYALERHEEAERELREAFRLEPRHARALNFLGYSLAERKTQLDEALSMIERALEVDSWNGAYLDSLGWVFYQLGRFEEARRPLERAALELPRDPVVLEHLGDLYLALGEVGGAIGAWKRALGAGPEDPEAVRGKIVRAERASGPIAAEAPAPTVDRAPR